MQAVICIQYVILRKKKKKSLKTGAAFLCLRAELLSNDTLEIQDSYSAL